MALFLGASSGRYHGQIPRLLTTSIYAMSVVQTGAPGERRTSSSRESGRLASADARRTYWICGATRIPSRVQFILNAAFDELEVLGPAAGPRGARQYSWPARVGSEESRTREIAWFWYAVWTPGHTIGSTTGSLRTLGRAARRCDQTCDHSEGRKSKNRATTRFFQH